MNEQLISFKDTCFDEHGFLLDSFEVEHIKLTTIRGQSIDLICENNIWLLKSFKNSIAPIIRSKKFNASQYNVMIELIRKKTMLRITIDNMSGRSTKPYTVGNISLASITKCDIKINSIIKNKFEFHIFF